MKRILVVGTGSVGLRHARNLHALGARVAVYRYRARADAGHDLPGGVTVVSDWQAAIADGVDGVVVANRTDLHLDVALQAAAAGRHLFIEKPLSHTLAGVAALQQAVRDAALAVEAGFMLRCHPNLRWMREFIATGDLGELRYLRAAVGQFLPDWRPGTDHRQGYGARRDWGGGVVLDLIHELDLVQWLAGAVEDVQAMTSHAADLEIETEAVAQIGLRLAGGVLAQVHLDYVRPVYGRTLEVVGSHGVLTWDYALGTVQLERPRHDTATVHRVPAGFERNTMFVEHMAHFLRRLGDPSLPPVSPLDDSVAVLRTALACHRSAAERRAVRPADLA